MSILRVIIIAGQLGNIWSKRRKNRKLFKSVSVIGYTLLMSQISRSKNSEKNQLFIVKDGKALVAIGRKKPKFYIKSKTEYFYPKYLKRKNSIK